MTVTHTHTEHLTFALTAEFEAPVEDVWRLWEDPRLLERWWGPPSYPATFVEYALKPGGAASYYMTGPDGERFHGWWHIREVEAPYRIVFEDGFADADGQPDGEMPTTVTSVRLEANGSDGTRMIIETTFASQAEMERLVQMGMEEGMALAVGQMDALLATGIEPGVSS